MIRAGRSEREVRGGERPAHGDDHAGDVARSSADETQAHEPVMRDEIRAAFADVVRGRGWIVDATVGAGGHARALLEALPQVGILAFDQDPDALDLAARTLADFGDRVRLERGRMSELCRALRKARVERPLGFLADLGASSMQLDRPERGFSFRVDGPLDMRMDPSRDRTAADIVNRWDESDLADLFYYEGDERGARRIARAIVEARRRAPFRRTAALADLVANVLGGRGGQRIHPATRTFQALRRAVNEEGDELLAGLACARHWLADGGLLAILTFHSGEDRVVKHALLEEGGPWTASTAGEKPLAAGDAEVRANPRARSAKLRLARRRHREQTENEGAPC